MKGSSITAQMSRRRDRVGVRLDEGDVRDLPEEEIRAILRAADPIIGTGGRTLLSGILKGSRRKDILERGLDQGNPSYGYYHDLTLDEIRQRIDWMIRNGYLEIRYEDRLPMIVYSRYGWDCERMIYAEELFGKCESAMHAGSTAAVLEELTEHTNPQAVKEVIRLAAKKGDALWLKFFEELSPRVSKTMRNLMRDAAKAIMDRE